MVNGSNICETGKKGSCGGLKVGGICDMTGTCAHAAEGGDEHCLWRAKSVVVVRNNKSLACLAQICQMYLAPAQDMAADNGPCSNLSKRPD